MPPRAPSDETVRRLAALPLPHEARVVHDQSFALVVPPSGFVVPRGWEWTHTAPFEGPSVLAGLVRGLGYRFRLFDQRDDFDPASLRGRTTGFDLVGLSVWGDSFAWVRRAVALLKDEDPTRPVVLGGPLASAAPQLLLATTRADFVVVGEGELTLTELLDWRAGNRFARPLAEIAGLVWRDGAGAVHTNAPRPQLADLDLLPFQDLSVWERFEGRPIPELYLSYSRGCANHCTFCYRAFPQLRFKSVERVAREIGYYRARGFGMAWWNDLTFVTDRDYVHRLLDTAFDGHSFRWCAFSRVTGLDEATLARMRDRGLDIVLYGMESVSPAVLAAYRKGISRSAMIDTIERHRRVGVKVGGLFIIGAPSDDRQTMSDLVSFCDEFREVTRVKYLSALPGTPFYDQCLRDGTIRDEVRHLEWLSDEQSVEEDIEDPRFVLFTPHLTRAELRATYRRVNHRVAVRPYDYRAPDSLYLAEGQAFARRRPETQA